MNTLRAAFIAALLSSASAYADSGPHCMAAIGTGGAAQSTPSSAATAAAKNPLGRPASPNWSAFIGTGHATDANHVSPVKSATAGLPTALPHGTSGIGTGCAAELNAGTGSSAVAAARAQP